ncbi:glycoside hydrolase family 127 protein [Thermostilla marina]
MMNARSFYVLVALMFVSAGRLAIAEPPAVRVPPHAIMTTVDADDVEWTDGFWGDYYRRNLQVTVPHVWKVCQLPDNAATFHDLRMAAGLAPKGPPGGVKWSDGDCHKLVETMAYYYAVTGDSQLERWMDEAVDIIAKAQEPDGYLSTWVQLSGEPRWNEIHNHELYNMGHFMTAAAVHYRMTGKRTYLDAARRCADYLYETFSPRPKELAHFGFNPSNIMGAVDLYRVTGEPKYLKLADIFVSMRGSAPGGTNQNQDLVPLRQEQEAVGHCVTATYLYCGAADVVAETGDTKLFDALRRLWVDVTTSKMYITGGTAALHHGVAYRRTLRPWPKDPVHEAFGMEYQLPNRTAYNETCANIGVAMWGRRMFTLTGDAEYFDTAERALYNSVLSAVSLEGTHFFYTNPLRRCGDEVRLLSNDTYERWADTTDASPLNCFCCPPNLTRTIAKLYQWAYDIGDDTVWVNLYGGNVLDTTLPDGDAIRLVQKSNYPWDGRVSLTIDKAPARPIALRLRIPGWLADVSSVPTLQLNGKPVDVALKPGSYVELKRTWSPGDHVELALPMEPVLIAANPLIDETRGQVAVMRGPVVYCLESPDLPEDVFIDDVWLDTESPITPRLGEGLFAGMIVLHAKGWEIESGDWQGSLYRRWSPAHARPIDLTLIPYFAWANRGKSRMTVWLPAR